MDIPTNGFLPTLWNACGDWKVVRNRVILGSLINDELISFIESG
jgi:hypothetical protein